MPSLSDTVARLAALRAKPAHRAAGGRLSTLNDFGSNPGALGAKVHVPEGLARQAALVVVLHGCTQTADDYDSGSGWSRMADRHGFAVLFPEQQRQNNPNLCFNWFAAEDIRRGGGEALSIRQMIAAMVEMHGIDPARIFVTGLSAGGAMTAVMLATYPELFAGGAIIAGLPYGTATSIPQALERMRGQGLPTEPALAALVRRASDYAGPWPTLSVWHGTADSTVDAVNGRAVVAQWRALHGVDAQPGRSETVDGYPRRVWQDRGGRDVIEEYSITGMGHGTPLAAAGPDGCGTARAHMLEAGISSTRHICAFWGLLDAHPAARAEPRAEAARAPLPAVAARRPERIPLEETPARTAAKTGPAKIIEDALRAAGLMR